MSDFEQLNLAWKQAEQRRHTALLQQLKAEVRAFRQPAYATATPALPVTQAPAAQSLPDSGESSLHHDDWTALDWSALDWSALLDGDHDTILEA